MNNFVKTHGLGNEYIVLNDDEIDFSLTSSLIQKICNVHYGIGSDGILLKVPSSKADFGLRIYNPDGSEAEKSGNGLRIFSKYLYDYKHTSHDTFTIETPGGIVTSEIIEKKNNKAFMIKVDMGKAIFESKNIPVSFPKELCFGEELVIDDKKFLIHCVSVGNPHCVILTDSLDDADTKKYGPLIENHPMFPNRINVQFAKVINRDLVEIRIWERGAGYTLASGSSSSAVACAMIRKGLTNRSITIQMPGGSLKIEVDDLWNIRMTGEVREVAYGTLSEELFHEN
jgi:diaminopimelate epimerase